MSCGVGRRCASDPTWLWLWCRPVAAALMQSVAWEFLYAMGAALKRKSKYKKAQNERKMKRESSGQIEKKTKETHLQPTSQLTATPDP